ncbi:MAG: ATP-binding cassette domain-containing protein [Canibacter sp.]
MLDSPALLLSGVTFSYGHRPVLDSVDLALRPGSILGLLGTNGAGKSTLISMATGLLQPDSGSVHVHGINVCRDRVAAAAHLGFAPQRLGVYPTLTSRENLMIFAEFARLRRRAARARVDEVLELLDLQDQANRVVGELSGGQQHRVHTGMALVGKPGLLF